MPSLIRTLEAVRAKIDISAGGAGSGCKGENCGRPSSGGKDPYAPINLHQWRETYSSVKGQKTYASGSNIVSVTLVKGKVIISEKESEKPTLQVDSTVYMRRVHEGTDKAEAAKFLQEKYGLTDKRLGGLSKVAKTLNDVNKQTEQTLTPRKGGYGLDRGEPVKPTGNPHDPNFRWNK